MQMSFVKFKKLNHLSNMPATITNGCIYFVKDVNKIFVDFDSERQAYSISESDVATYTEAAVDESFADLLAKLEAIETTLKPEVKSNYQELLNKLKEIGKYFLDISKLTFGGLIISSIVGMDFDLGYLFIYGIA